MVFHFHQRTAASNCPAGFTVSRSQELPKGDFRITEYLWGRTALWFVDQDKFTANDRCYCYQRPDLAAAAAREWDGTGDPFGWFKNPQTQQYQREFSVASVVGGIV